MQNSYEKIAHGISQLGMYSQLLRPRIPIGFDGAVIEELLGYYCRKKGLYYVDCLDKTVEISSHYSDSDSEKFKKVLDSFDNKAVYAVDMRTKTGTLVKSVKRMFEHWKVDVNKPQKELTTVVLFDPYHHADISILHEPLSDEERIKWFPDYESIKNLFKDDQGNWRENYLTTHEIFSKLENMKKIKELL